MRHLFTCTVLVLASACASAPKPALLNDVDALRDSATAREARQLVPQALARAEKLREDAEAAWPKGQTATAEILAERAIVAYSDARELSRIVRAEQRLLEAKARVHDAELGLLKLDADQKKAAAEAADLDAQLLVMRESEALAEPQPSTPEREHARQLAAKTTLSQAQLLCVSARLLRSAAAPAATGDVEAALAELAAIEAKLSAGKQPTPIREAVVARSRCQGLLTETRRAGRIANPTSEQPDQLFVELSEAGLFPSRDDRGIAVTLPGLAGSDGLDREVLPQLAALARLAQNHDQTPLLVVSHAKRGDPKPADRKQAQAVADKLREGGAKHLEVEAVGGRLPLARAGDLGAAARNERLEVIFVTRL
jgi:hypothetical protein